MAPSDRRGGSVAAPVAAALLVVALGLLLAPGLGRPQLTLYDEAFHAVVARHLLQHPFHLTLYDVPLLESRRPDWVLGLEWWHSPPLAIWQMAGSIALFGATTLSLRLPSALLHAGAALLTYRIGRALFGRAVGAAAAVLQAFSPQLVASVLGYHPSGHLHIALLFWTEAGAFAAIRGAQASRPAWFAAAGAALGLAFLAGAAPALALAGMLVGACVASRAGFTSAPALRVRARDVALALCVAALPVGMWVGYGAVRDRDPFLREVAGWFRAPGAARFAPPWETFDFVAGYLPGLAIVALLALCVVTARAARHPGDRFLALWAWAGVLPVTIATGARAGAAALALPALVLALTRLVDLAVQALPQRSRLGGVAVVAGVLTLAGVTVRYALEDWRITRREPHDTALVAQALRLRADFPSDAVFLTDERDPNGAYLSLMFWSDRPVHSLALLRRTSPLLSNGIAARRVRKLGGIPYLLTPAPVPDAPVPADSVGPYLVYAIGPTATGAPTLRRANAPPAMDWPAYGGEPGGTKYSPVAEIDRSNVARLQLAWTWRTGERPWQAQANPRRARPGRFETTPLMIGDTLFLTTPYHRVVALDAETGAELWTFDPKVYQRGQPFGAYGFVHRGVAAWSDGSRRRLFHASRGRLFALDAATGELATDFGDSGSVDLVKALGWSGNPEHVDNTSPPVVYRDLVIVGSSIPDEITYPGDPPGAVVAFDARTGRQAWIFHTIPRAGEQGHETWGGGTEGAGHANVWAPMTVDTARGLVYLPVGAASNDWYGARRPGANLFSESLVCLDALTGKRRWHFQTVHHGLWDYDLAAPPVLATVRRGDRAQDVVAVATKTGFVFVFDRVTGTPVWPIEERPVPASDVPGEMTAPTQPFPTRPAPFVRQGFSEDDIIDFTPRLRDSVRAALRGVRFGPIFTPPSRAGTVVVPGWIGGGAWGGAAYDPESQLLFIKGNNQPVVIQLTPAGPPSDSIDAEFIGLRKYLGRTAPGAVPPDAGRFDWLSARQARVAQPLPITKPPYGTVTAIDLVTGEHRWQATVGNWGDPANHPLLRGVKLPPLGAVGVSGPMATGGGLVFIAGGSTSVHALDSRTGEQLWEAPLGGVGHANPMTYRTRNGRQFIVIASTLREGGELLAFALPWR